MRIHRTCGKVAMSSTIKQLQWNDAHFCGLRSQTNIYSLSKIFSCDGLTKVLAASVDGHIASVEYQNSFNRLLPITKETVLFGMPVGRDLEDVQFSSGMAASSAESNGEPELVSFDIMHIDDSEKIALAITYLMVLPQNVALDDDKVPQAFMNTYLLSVEEKERSCSNIINELSQSCPQHSSLEFIPFMLTHHQAYLETDNWVTCFLLSGNDHKIHVYRQHPEHEIFQEDPNADDLFPEFKSICGSVTQLELRQQNDTHRLTCLGTQMGLITLYYVNVVERKIINSWTRDFDSPITSMHFFNQHKNVKHPDFISAPKNLSCHCNKEGSEIQVQPTNLLVTSALNPSAVFHDILGKGLSKCLTLPNSNSVDAVLCSCVMDTDFDGENEVLIGTYGQVVIAYKLTYEEPQVLISTPFQLPAPSGATDPLPASFDSWEKSEQSTSQGKDVRRRHKSFAAHDNSSVQEKQEKHKSDEVDLYEDHLKDGPTPRLFRSHENLASLTTKCIHFATPDQSISDCSLPHSVQDFGGDNPSYKLIWTRHFCDPVMGLACDDVMGDGMSDLIVLSLKGLHILQPDLEEVSHIVLERLQHLDDFYVTSCDDEPK